MSIHYKINGITNNLDSSGVSYIVFVYVLEEKKIVISALRRFKLSIFPVWTTIIKLFAIAATVKLNIIICSRVKIYYIILLLLSLYIVIYECNARSKYSTRDLLCNRFNLVYDFE